jgi:hypothetical protein
MASGGYLLYPPPCHPTIWTAQIEVLGCHQCGPELARCVHMGVHVCKCVCLCAHTCVCACMHALYVCTLYVCMCVCVHLCMEM